LLNLYIDRQEKSIEEVQNSLDDIRAKHHKIFVNAKNKRRILLLAQLNAELSGDADCEAILDKLMRRVSTLMMGEFDPKIHCRTWFPA